MSDIESASTTPSADAPGFFIVRHYLSDLSVECPFGRIDAEHLPALRMGHDLRMEAIPLDAVAGVYRVDIFVRLTAAVNEQVVFVAELTYRVDVQLHLIAEANLLETLVVEVPNAMQPVLRAIFEQNGEWAGYPDMRVVDLDFAKAYAQGQMGTVN